jgi:hypothetical protein
MDGSQFDVWTRRGFGAAAGGLAGSLLALSALPVAEAKKKKKKKKRCGKLGDPCNDGSKTCCCGFTCPSAAITLPPRSCCRAVGFPAKSPNECCSTLSELGHCICKSLGQPCGTNQQCCSNQCAGNNTCTTIN